MPAPRGDPPERPCNATPAPADGQSTPAAGRETTSTAFVPPNANELEIAWQSAGAGRAAPVTRSIPKDGSTAPVLAVGGRRPATSADAVASSSTAPPAPSR